ncbi:MAG: flagellar hook-associated protein FlgL [Oligoflexales bacterium]
MRISERQRYDVAANRMNKAREDNVGMLDMLSTQKKINAVSDDPVSAARVIQERGRLKNLEQYQKNILYSRGYLERTESAISGIHDGLIRAKELAIAMSNDTYDYDSRDAAAREIKEVIDGIVSLGNTTYGNRYVFGGFRTQTPPLSSDGKYGGDDGAIFLQIDENLFRQINVQARQLFEASEEELQGGHFNMVHTLNTLFEGLKSDDKEMIRSSLEELDFQMSKSSSYQATLGSIQNALDSAGQRVELTDEMSREAVSVLEDADSYKSISDFNRTETVLQSTLMASNKLLQPSLLNFLQ